ncbi:hypothetical protein ACFLYI_00555 [Chloroflexota bacterium]
MAKRKEEEVQSESTELNPPNTEETEFQQEAAEESSIAKANLITGDKRMTMSAPVKEFDDFKHSFKSMMTAFANFIEAAGLEIGKDETNAQIVILNNEFERLRKDMQAEKTKMWEESISRAELEDFKADMEVKDTMRRAESVSQSDLDELKATIEATETKNRESSVPRVEFEEYKAAITEKEATLQEDYVTRGEFERFRTAVRTVI